MISGHASSGENVVKRSERGGLSYEKNDESIDHVFCYLRFFFIVQLSGNPIRNGYYMIRTGSSSDRVLDINNNDMNNGANLEMYKKNGMPNQVYYVKYRGNEYLRYTSICAVQEE